MELSNKIEVFTELLVNFEPTDNTKSISVILSDEDAILVAEELLEIGVEFADFDNQEEEVNEVYQDAFVISVSKFYHGDTALYFFEECYNYDEDEIDETYADVNFVDEYIEPYLNEYKLEGQVIVITKDKEEEDEFDEEEFHPFCEEINFKECECTCCEEEDELTETDEYINDTIEEYVESILQGEGCPCCIKEELSQFAEDIFELGYEKAIEDIRDQLDMSLIR